MIKHKNTIYFTILLLITTVLVSCYPSSSIPIDDLDTTSTFRIPEDFEPAPISAAIFWDVVQVKNDDAEDLPYLGEIDDEILNTTLDNLVNLYGVDGVVIISKTESPFPTPSNPNVKIVTPADGEPDVDVAVAPSIVLRRQYVGVVYPGYPWWPGWGGGWWGPCYYCGYPPNVSYTKYDVGTVVLDMVDIRKFSNGVPNDVTPSWVAVNRGLLSSNKEFNSERTVTGINQAFSQSKYLK